MKRNNIITVIFPALVMLVISLISFTDISSLSDLAGKGLIIGGLVVVYLITWVIGYLLTKFFIKSKVSKK